MVVSEDGIIFNWKKDYDPYGNEVASNGTHNLRYGTNLGESEALTKSRDIRLQSSSTDLGIAAVLMIVISIVVTVGLFCMLRRIPKHD